MQEWTRWWLTSKQVEINHLEKKGVSKRDLLFDRFLQPLDWFPRLPNFNRNPTFEAVIMDQLLLTLEDIIITSFDNMMKISRPGMNSKYS